MASRDGLIGSKSVMTSHCIYEDLRELELEFERLHRTSVDMI